MTINTSTIVNTAKNIASTVFNTFNPLASAAFNAGLGVLGYSQVAAGNAARTLHASVPFRTPLPSGFEASLPYTKGSFAYEYAIELAQSPSGIINVYSDGTAELGRGGRGIPSNLQDLQHDALISQGFKGIPEVTQRRQLDVLQTSIDVIGIYPGAGDVADLANAGISAARGHYGAAALSAVSAIPVVGAVVGYFKATRAANNSLAVVDLIADGQATQVRVGTIDALKKVGATDRHHIIQDASLRDIPGYKSTNAPAIELPGPPNKVGSIHYNATQVQRQAGGGTYAAERRIGYKALRTAGVSENDARRIIEAVDDFFSGLGVTPSTITRIPGDRARGN